MDENMLNEADHRQGTAHEPHFSWTPEQVLETLKLGNEAFVAGSGPHHRARVEARDRLAREGQSPRAVVVTCSDSRVPPSACFSAQLGDLFIVRSIGAYVGESESASVEYGVTHLACPLVVVMGHTHCGMVAAAMDGATDGLVGRVVAPLHELLDGEQDPRAAELASVRMSVGRIAANPEIARHVAAGSVRVVGALYDIVTGEVCWL